jgi:hypothetical protein
MPEETVQLRVKPHIPLPYVATCKEGEFTFDPECVVPTELARTWLRTWPNRFEPVTNKTDVSQYVFTDTYKTKTIAELVGGLNEKHKGEVYKLAGKLAEKEEEGRKKAAEKELREEAKRRAKEAKGIHDDVVPDE